MDRFVSNTINRVDKKGRVSIPAPFRLVLGSQPVLHTILSVDYPVVEAGGPQFMDGLRRRLDLMDPLSEEFEVWSFYLEGDAAELKIDPEGRIALTDHLRAHAGISDEVAFVGRGNFFQLWEPEAFRAYREMARAKVRDLRRMLGNSARQTVSPAGWTGPGEEQER
ncbi:MAG: hypothetical protein KDJ80_03810 [Nitratireductor sp.]|nr:hypothetical protein [Nitratireductor sp.]